MLSPKLKYSLLCGLTFPCFGFIVLSGTGHSGELYRYLVPGLVGLTSGYIIGLIKSRWVQTANTLVETNRELARQVDSVHRLNRELQESKDYLQAILDNATLPIYLKDADGKYILINRQYERLAHISRDAIKGLTDFEIFPQPVAHLFVEQDNEVKKMKVARDFEETIPLPDGEMSFITCKFPLHDAEGKIYAVGGVCTDITARKRAEELLAAKQEQLTVTLHSIADGVISTDTRGFITMINAVAESLTGWSATEAVGLHLEEIFRVYDNVTGRECESPVETILSTGEIIELTDNTFLLDRQGHKHPIADSAAPIRDHDGDIIGVVIVFRDITATQRMDQEMLNVKKLKSLGVLAGGIAHDFNNILAAIMGNLSLAIRKIEPDHEIAELLNSANKASMRAQNLTQQLLTFSMGGDPVKETAAISEVITDSAEFVLRGSNVSCSYHIPESLWLVDIDKGQMSQVIQNIIINADQAMAEGGTIDIICENIPASSQGAFPMDKQDHIRITIKDHGPGISADIIEKIYDPFFSTKEEGSGLGLTVTHSIIRKHSGLIEVSSEPDSGTTFTIRLPASSKKTSSAISRTPSAHVSGQGRILIMDDEEMILIIVADMVEQLGFQATTCHDGSELLKLYQESLDQGEAPVAVIMDLTIPGGMGGKEAMQELLKLHATAQVIVSSGYSNNPVMANYRDYGFKATISKPYNFDQLSAVLHRLLSS